MFSQMVTQSCWGYQTIQSNTIMISTCFEIDQDFKYPSTLHRSTVLVTTI